MSQVLNGVTMSTLAGANHLNGSVLTFAYLNGVKEWEAKAAAGSETITYSKQFTVPQGVYSLNLCICAGAGAGATVGDVSYSVNYGGGQQGQIITTSLAVTPGQIIDVVIGIGGTPGAAGSLTNGGPGGNTSFGAIVALGGPGGLWQSRNYNGVGAAHTYCGGTYNDGTTAGYGGGGEAGGFGHGGNAGFYESGLNGGIGAGGGPGAAGFVRGGYGGPGQVVVSWS